MDNKILHMAEGLSSGELYELVKHLNRLYKQKLVQENISKARAFKMGDIVAFEEKGRAHTGVVLKISPNKITLLTTDEQRWKIPPIRLQKCEDPSEEVITLKEEILGPFKGIITWQSSQ